LPERQLTLAFKIRFPCRNGFSRIGEGSRGHHDESPLGWTFRQRESNHGLIVGFLSIGSVVDFEPDRFSAFHEFRGVVVSEIQRLAAWCVDGLHRCERTDSVQSGLSATEVSAATAALRRLRLIGVAAVGGQYGGSEAGESWAVVTVQRPPGKSSSTGLLRNLHYHVMHDGGIARTNFDRSDPCVFFEW